MFNVHSHANGSWFLGWSGGGQWPLWRLALNRIAAHETSLPLNISINTDPIACVGDAMFPDCQNVSVMVLGSSVYGMHRCTLTV